MMSVPGFQRRGGGISFSSFHYKPEDVDCQYCLHYRRKSCQIPICPYIAERLASGALEYHDLILECLGRNLRLRLYQRIRSVTHWDGPDQAILHKIRPYCQKEANRPQEDIPSVYWAALYLLASRESLWKTAVPALASGYIDFHCISCRGLAVRDYPIFYSAKRLYERKFPMDAGELASRSLIDDQDFLNILYATLIARYAPQPGVTVAMRRDMELSGCEAVEMIREELIEPEYEGIEYTYIFNQDGKWLYFPVGEEYEWRDLKEDLENDTIHIAEPDAELMEALGLTGEEWDENLEEDNIKQEMYGGI